ncbi:hypothetical protein AALC25_07205 [Lachnospiraceae bacterium 29-84]
MKKHTALRFLAFFTCLILFSGCTGKGNQMPNTPYAVGVIDSANYGRGTTYFHLYDDSLQKLGVLDCPYHAVGSYGSTPLQITGGKLYEVSLNNLNTYDGCAVVSMDLTSGEWEHYPFEEIAYLQDFRATEDGLFVIGNLNQSAYLSYQPLPNGTPTTIEIEATSATGLSVNGYDVYFTGVDSIDEGSSLYHVNVKERSQEKLLDVTELLEESNFLYTQWHNGELYIPNFDRISIYNPDENKLRHIPLPGEYACQILLDQDRMYIVDCDQNNNGETDIYRYHPDTQEAEATYHFTECAMVSHIQNGILYTLEQDPVTTVRKYELSPDGAYKKLAETTVEAKAKATYRISDMFVKP